MNNKLLAALAMTTELATSAHSACQINSGAYVGLSVGGAHLGGKNDASIKNDVAGNINPSKESKLSSTSFAAAILGGYGLKVSNFWLAAELFYQFDNLSSKSKFKIDTNSKDEVLESKSNGAFGGSFHIGFIAANNCVVYAIAGVEGRRFKVKYTPDTAVHSTTIDKSYTSTAFAPGIGLRVSLSKNIALKTEYKYAIHKTKTFTDKKANPGGAGDNDTLTVKHSPNIHSFNVGVVYSF